MKEPRRDVAFILVATDHGTMILNRYDQCINKENNVGFGVGYELLNRSMYEPAEVSIAMELFTLRRKHFGDGVKVIDCGANIGTHTVSWARHMNGWGDVTAIEAQERIFYALCGNIALNNCFNAKAINAAVGLIPNGFMKIPQPEYREYGSFGSLELQKDKDGTIEYIGQTVNYSPLATVDVRAISIDSLCLDRLDFLKIDVEGMELEVLSGANATIRAYHPIISAEILKVPKKDVTEWLEGLGYVFFPFGNNVLGVHRHDPTLKDVQERQEACGA